MKLPYYMSSNNKGTVIKLKRWYVLWLRLTIPIRFLFIRPKYFNDYSENIRIKYKIFNGGLYILKETKLKQS